MFSSNLKKARLSKGYTQQQMADLLKLGSYNAYQNYERGTREPSLNMLVSISKILNVSIDVLLDNAVPSDEC